MIKQLFCVVAICMVTIGTAQVRFEKGYFINNSGIKTECFIKNYGWKDNPKEIEYKITLTDEVKKQTINTIQAFEIIGQSKYKRFEVTIDRSTDKTSFLSTDKAPKFNTENLLLKVLIEGDATLYEYSEKSLQRFFYSTATIDIEQLIYKRYKVKTSKIAKNTKFRQQLWMHVRCEGTTINDVNNVDYYRNELNRYFIKYNRCVNPDFTEGRKKISAKEKFNLTIRPGINIANVQYDDNVGSSRADVVEFGDNLSFRLGLEAEYILPFNKNKWAVFVEPTFLYFQVKDKEVTYIPGSQSLSTVDGSIDYLTLEIPIGIRYYMFLNDKSKLFINTAFVTDLDFSSSITLELQSSTADNPVVLADPEISAAPNFAIGLGYNFNNQASLELRYFSNRDLLANKYTDQKADYNALSIILGYTFF